MWDSWPDSEHFRRLRSKGFAPRRYASVEVVEGRNQLLDESDDEHQYMPNQLRDEVSSEFDVNLISQAIDDVTSGRHQQREETGNAWTVIIEPDGVSFEFTIMDGEQGGKVSIATYRAALEAWRQFLIDEDCDERIVEIPDD